MKKISKILRNAEHCSRILFSLGILSLFAFPNSAFATGSQNDNSAQVEQNNRKVTVTVANHDGEPIIGASVFVLSTQSGAATDVNGQCEIEVPIGGQIRVSYIGFTSKIVSIGNASTVNVVLSEDSHTLDDVVVVGYGVMKKSDVTGSIGVVKGADLLKTQNFSALDNLRGKVSGVNIFSNSSQLGASTPRVIIRGMATINASSDPLYVVDGVVMNNFSLSNPNDIESMEVLKDASATAIYGARGANGVILITTKRGLQGAEGSRISYEGSVSVKTMARKMSILNAEEWCTAFMKGLENENKYQGKNWSLNRKDWFTDSNYFDSNGNPLFDTDWQDEATRNAISHNHQLNIQQSGKNSSMGAFLNFTDDQGLMLNTFSKRLNGKLAYDTNPTQWLSTSVNLMANHMWSRYTDEGGGNQEARRTMIEMLPWLPVKDADGNYTTSATPSAMADNFGFEGMSNPVMILDLQKRMYYNTQIFGNAALTFHLLQGLDLKTQFGVDWHNMRNRRYASKILNNISMPNGRAEYNNWENFYWQEETYLTYLKNFGSDHRFNGMLGLSWQEYTSRSNGAVTEGFPDDFYEDNNMGVGTSPESPSSNFDRWAMNSYFLRFAYTYKDRYSATVTGRLDGSSKFGKNNKYAFFPSAGLAWIVSEEDFLKNVDAVSNLKLHTSYGLTGNSEIGTYRSLARIGAGTHLQNGVRAPYSYISSMSNPDLKWEKTAQFDIGFELGLFKNALNFDISYYNKKTTDLLLDCPIPHSTGFESIFKNIGSVKNSGLDIMINAYPVRTKDLTWISTLNMNYNKNEILHLGETNADIELLGWVGGSENILRVGESMGSFYGYRRYGIITEDMQKTVKWTEADVQQGLCTKEQVGTSRFSVSQIGRPNRSANKEILGKGIPDWTGSWINTLNYKNWDLTLDLQFVMGVETMQQFFHPTYDRFGITNGLTDILYNSYNGSNPETMEQMIYLCNSGHAGQDTTVDSSWICDGSYLRLNMLQIGYTFSSNALGNVGLSSLRFYASGNNLFLLCSKDFKGYDPESTSQDSKFGQNMTFYSYPRARIFTLGVNVSF